MRNLFFSIVILFIFTGCQNADQNFEATINKIELLEGLILKGLAITGTVSKGCIANNDWFTVYRNGEEIQKADSRLLNIANLKEGESFDGKADKGDEATFYIPDGKLGDVLVGDIIVSNEGTCK
ncbi:hypothetical protein [Teredinibacter haidensis]|uniref:hypothetical protein n=1 Tax=Teredinibacter haidensis TaxID=2731755 RepID=UPI0009491A2A|nr:hypothetical protein [Teredinibacter haidensis]